MENTTNITPPPFKKQDVECNPQEKTPSTTSANSTPPPEGDDDALASLGLDETTEKRIHEMLLNAETKGYLRGRNEKIEATQHFEQDNELDPQPTGFPVYNRRSVWDC